MNSDLNPFSLIAPDKHLILLKIASDEKKTVIIKTDTDKKPYLYGIVIAQGDQVLTNIGNDSQEDVEGMKCIYDRTQARDFVHNDKEYTTIHKDAALTYYPFPATTETK